MYCARCGEKIPDGSGFCPHCGKIIADRQNKTQESTAELVKSARNGDQLAISILYERTYHQAYYTVKAMIRDDDTVFDILQDSYIKAFSRLDGFEGGEKFPAWVRQIAANTARDWLKKQRPLLFSELEQGDDLELPAEERFEDENTDHLPEHVIDRDETARLIREILDELPEDQRAAIGMYYYEELSVKEIAAAMGATENAVKSRLLYGRRKIEKKVRELEKKGTKLYGLAPIPFLLWLLRGQKASAAELPDAGILQNILHQVSAPSAASSGGTAAAAKTGAVHAAKAAGTAKAASATGGGLSAAKITVAAIAAAAAIGGGAYGISRLSKPAEPAVPVPASITVAEVPEDPEVPEMPPVTVPTEAAEITLEAERPEDPSEEALAQYREIIANAAAYDFGEYAYPNGTYRYALEYIQEGDPVPSLLLCQCGEDFIDYIRVFRYDPSAETPVAPEEILSMGAAQTGGYRVGLDMMADGSGICITSIDGMRGDISVSRAVLSEEHLVTKEVWTGYLEQEDPSRPETREIIWYDASDPGGLAVPEKGAGTDGASSDWAKSEQAAGRIVLRGTINTYGYDDVIRLQDAPDPNAAYTNRSWTYRIIVLEAPQVLGGNSVDGYEERNVSMICVSGPYFDGADIPAGLDGQAITFSIGNGSLSWPSDTSLPLGAPKTTDIRVMP